MIISLFIEKERTVYFWYFEISSKEKIIVFQFRYIICINNYSTNSEIDFFTIVDTLSFVILSNHKSVHLFTSNMVCKNLFKESFVTHKINQMIIS